MTKKERIARILDLLRRNEALNIVELENDMVHVNGKMNLNYFIECQDRLKKEGLCEALDAIIMICQKDFSFDNVVRAITEKINPKNHG